MASTICLSKGFSRPRSIVEPLLNHPLFPNYRFITGFTGRFYRSWIGTGGSYTGVLWGKDGDEISIAGPATHFTAGSTETFNNIGWYPQSGNFTTMLLVHPETRGIFFYESSTTGTTNVSFNGYGINSKTAREIHFSITSTGVDFYCCRGSNLSSPVNGEMSARVPAQEGPWLFVYKCVGANTYVYGPGFKGFTYNDLAAGSVAAQSVRINNVSYLAANRNGTGSFSYFGSYDYALSDSAIEDLINNPWQLFKQDKSKIWFDVGRNAPVLSGQQIGQSIRWSWV